MDRGWSPLGREKAVRSSEEDDKKKSREIPDIKESFDYGNAETGYNNIWPDEVILPNFRKFNLKYFDIMTSTAENILNAISLGMDLEENYLTRFHTQRDNVVKLIHYPPTRESDLRCGKSERIGTHTDFGGITLLLQDECGGLEVESPSKGKFIPAPYIRNSLIVNTGDFLMRWSNNYLKSTLHRVRAPAIDSWTGITKERYSIPFFVNTNRDAVISCLPGTYSEDNPPKYEPIKSSEYFDRRLADFYG